LKPPHPRDAVALEPGEFGVAFQIALDSGRAAPQHPEEQATFALKRHFGADTKKYQSAILRFRAVMELYRKGDLGRWVRRSGEGGDRTEIHPAVLDVASRMRLARNGRFPVRKFLADVAETAARNYADLREWPLGTDPGA